MGKLAKFLQSILSGTSDQNIAFTDLRNFLKRIGFIERIRGDHYIFSKDGISEIINLQPAGAKAKPYQVKQVRGIIVGYKLANLNEGEADAD